MKSCRSAIHCTPTHHPDGRRTDRSPLLRAIERADDSLHRSKFDIRISCSAKECRARGYLDLDIGYSPCLGPLLKRMLRIREHRKIGYIPLIERLHKSVNGAVAMAGQLAHDTINGDAGCTCNSF